MNKIDWWESWLMRKLIDEKVDWRDSQLMRKLIDYKVDWWESPIIWMILGFDHWRIDVQTDVCTDGHCEL